MNREHRIWVRHVKVGDEVGLGDRRRPRGTRRAVPVVAVRVMASPARRARGDGDGDVVLIAGPRGRRNRSVSARVTDSSVGIKEVMVGL